MALTGLGALHIMRPVHTIQCRYGAIAQLGERLHGMQEVSGSIPLSSTKSSSHRDLVFDGIIWCGAIAQLGERLHGMQEVSGSIPLSSTKFLSQYHPVYFSDVYSRFFRFTPKFMVIVSDKPKASGQQRQ